jgi:hypothetical protein
MHHSSLLRGLCTGLVLAVAACSGQTASSSGSGDSSGLHASIGPIDVPAGVETTQCIVVPLGNTEDVVLDGYDINLTPGSHHLIVYLTTQSVQTDPVNCSPFTGLALGTDIPVAFAGKEQMTWSFPTGVAIDIPANQNIKIEAHYINTTATDLQGQGNVAFHTTPKATAPAYQPAGFSFFGTFNIDIPPNSTYSTGPLYQAGPSGTQLISITTHEHRLGTRAQAWASAQPGDTSNQIADDQDWSQPAWKLLDPQFAFNGTSGLTYQCDWTNTTDQTVSFGESALDEMCFVGGYFYPGSGLYFCADNGCRHRN